MSSSRSSREDSPDWLRSFQAPTQSALTISSGSVSPLSDDEDEVDLNKLFQKERSDGQVAGHSQADQKTLKTSAPGKNQKAELQTPRRKRKKEREDHCARGGERRAEKRAAETRASEMPIAPSEPNDSVWTLSSDSDSLPDSKPDALITKTLNKKLKCEGDKPSTPEKVHLLKNRETVGDLDIEENLSEKCSGLHASSRLPLVLTEKVQHSKALVECEGDSIDLSGDVGAVGRVVISDDSSGNHEILLDLKGTIYRTNILPSRTFCVVSFGQSEAKIEAIMNDFIQLKPQANFYEAETMVEGTLDGFSFDSEEEVDNLPKALNNQGEGAMEQCKGKIRQKAEKVSGALQKQSKTGGGKKVKRKAQAPRKSRTKK
ncbi:DNA-binding protein BIN4 isoform X2 [Coffea eugenioides]|uniref:DNA-binding protein BIN4 isoform X2 n=1 Tax=Coffea eugenioides TaxID=49369 RepID=UPI000F6086E7|nr:DNA-binding protein BIN4 isoform X2 [Coffea eugenioides]